MITEIDKKSIEGLSLPFDPVLFDIPDSKFTLREDPNRHTTLLQSFKIDNSEVSVKSFFMDWFYYGFPKNMMKTASEYFSNGRAIQLEFSGRVYNCFIGEDYKGRSSACIFLNGTCLEFRSSFLDEKLLHNLFSRAEQKLISRGTRFHEKSFYATHMGPYSWFEDERIGRLSWKDSGLYSIGEFDSDSTGILPGLHKISIFKNKHNEYLWLDVAAKAKGVRNLSYRFNFRGNLFTENLKMNSWRVAILSQNGPALMVKETPFFRHIMALPAIEPGDLWKYVDIIENLNFDPFMP